MAKEFIVIGLFYFASFAASGVVDIRNEDSKGKEPEKKPNIVKDYICLRDGELCHPEFGRNRGLYVSCSNGIAWEQQCPRCSYHPLNCPTRTLWFDGEKCDWASPKLASQPCIDRFPVHNLNTNADKDGESAVSEQESLLESLQVTPIMSVQATGIPMKELVEKNQWQMNPMASSLNVPIPMYFKSPSYDEIVKEPPQEIDLSNDNELKEVKAVEENDSAEEYVSDSSDEKSSNKVELKSGDSNAREGGEPEFPSYLSAEDSEYGSKIVRLNDPVYALVNNPDGSGKQVYMRISQPYILEDQARSTLRSLSMFRSLY